MSLVRRQLQQTRKEMAQAQRAEARARLKELKFELKAALSRRAVRKREVGQQCRAARKKISARAREARARLSAAIERTRERARSECRDARAQVQLEGAADIQRALDALTGERGYLGQLAAWTRPTAARSTRAERRVESDDEVRANIDDPGLLVVWERVRGKIKPRGRTSRTEVFAEWVAEHSAEVYAIQEAELERQIGELEREELQLQRYLHKAAGKAGRRERLASAVPF